MINNSNNNDIQKNINSNKQNIVDFIDILFNNDSIGKFESKVLKNLEKFEKNNKINFEDYPHFLIKQQKL